MRAGLLPLVAKLRLGNAPHGSSCFPSSDLLPLYFPVFMLCILFILPLVAKLPLGNAPSEAPASRTISLIPKLCRRPVSLSSRLGAFA